MQRLSKVFQKSHCVFGRFLPFEWQRIKVDLIVFWHAHANSQAQPVIRERIENEDTVHLIFLPDIQAGSNLIFILPSSSRAKFHPVSSDLLSRSARCTSLRCVSLMSFPEETISPEWSACEPIVTWRPAFGLMSWFFTRSTELVRFFFFSETFFSSHQAKRVFNKKWFDEISLIATLRLIVWSDCHFTSGFTYKK
jgi:hypothetical protein